MTLQVARYPVADLAWSDTPGWSARRLRISRAALRAEALSDPRIRDVQFEVARPGEGFRINRVLDVIEPRTKAPGDGVTFPGIATDEQRWGSGTTSALSGMGIVATGTLAAAGQTFVQEDALIDMFEPGAALSPFGRTVNLVVTYESASSADVEESSVAFREANVRLARLLAQWAERSDPERVDVIPPREHMAPTGLPGVVYVCSLISEGFLHDTLLYGQTTEHLRPRWLDPAELLDGALVSSDFHYACQRVPTYLYQNNPILDALLRRDGSSVDLRGVILTIRYGSDDEKRAGAQEVAKLATDVGADAVITHPAVGGNAQLDSLYIVQECERLGVRAAMLVQEMAGRQGEDSPLVDFVPEADALVSTGNRDEVVELPAAAGVLGAGTLMDGTAAGGPLRLPMRLLCASTSQVGALPVTTVAT